MAYTSELNISHNIKELPKTSCSWIKVDDLLVCHTGENQLLWLYLFMF